MPPPISGASNAGDFEALARDLREEIGVCRVTIRERGSGAFGLVAEARDGDVGTLAGTEVSPDHADVLAALAEGRVLVQPDVAEAEVKVAAELGERYAVIAQIVAPVLVNNELLGIVSVHDTRGPRDWSESEVQAVVRVAVAVASVLR